MIVVCGPTAAGKTACGIALALALNGEIVSAEQQTVLHSWCVQSEWDAPTVVVGAGAAAPGRRAARLAVMRVDSSIDWGAEKFSGNSGLS